MVFLATTPAMAADARSLVHGGFVFGAADFAAMLAVNHPHVVRASADVRFTAPVAVGQTLRARALVVSAAGRERQGEVEVVAVCDDPSAPGEEVFRGTFHAAVLDHHVLQRPAR